MQYHTADTSGCPGKAARAGDGEEPEEVPEEAAMVTGRTSDILDEDSGPDGRRLLSWELRPEYWDKERRRFCLTYTTGRVYQ